MLSFAVVDGAFQMAKCCWKSVSKLGKEKVYIAGLTGVHSKIDAWEKFWFILTSIFYFVSLLFYNPWQNKDFT